MDRVGRARLIDASSGQGPAAWLGLKGGQGNWLGSRSGAALRSSAVH